jgi:hypothetical protein
MKIIRSKTAFCDKLERKMFNQKKGNICSNITVRLNFTTCRYTGRPLAISYCAIWIWQRAKILLYSVLPCWYSTAVSIYSKSADHCKTIYGIRVIQCKKHRRRRQHATSQTTKDTLLPRYSKLCWICYTKKTVARNSCTNLHDLILLFGIVWGKVII